MISVVRALEVGVAAILAADLATVYPGPTAASGRGEATVTGPDGAGQTLDSACAGSSSDCAFHPIYLGSRHGPLLSPDGQSEAPTFDAMSDGR